MSQFYDRGCYQSASAFDMAMVRRAQSPEHQRRHDEVLTFSQATGYRVPLAELEAMMPTSRCSAEEFDRRLGKLYDEVEQHKLQLAPYSKPDLRVLP